MRSRAIIDLVNLSDKDFLVEISEGLTLVHANVRRLSESARDLDKPGHHSVARILLHMAEEEAAKYLILLDAVRCPRKPMERIREHLRRFYDHLAKGIYAESCHWRAGRYGEFVSYTESHRQEYFLDGPNDVDWIFSNDITTRREDAIYVNYVDTDDRLQWIGPRSDKELDAGWGLPPSAVIELVEALHAAGCDQCKALKLIAKHWRQHEMRDDLNWQELQKLNKETLDLMAANNLLTSTEPTVVSTIVNRWTFPLYAADLTLIKVSQDELRRVQDSWSPDW